MPRSKRAIASGAVGEQADGYLGFPKPPAASLKAKVDAINIKRREGYTQVAQAKNVPIEAFAASIGCKTLAALKSGRSYSVARASGRPRAPHRSRCPASAGGDAGLIRCAMIGRGLTSRAPAF